MSIIAARDELLRIAARLNTLQHDDIAREIVDVVNNHMYRQAHKPRRATIKNRPMTVELKYRIRSYALNNPNLSNQEVANKFGVNPGRVSEALA